MSQSLVSNRVHVIFTTKDGRTWIAPEHQQRLWTYIIGIGKNKGVPVLAIGGMEDHIHILIALARVRTLGQGRPDDQGQFIAFHAAERAQF